MATQYTGWKCTHTASITSQTDTTVTIKVTCYWKNDGWRYNISGITANVYCNGVKHTVLSNGSVNTSTMDYTASKELGSYSFTVNKKESAQSISCYAEIDSNSSYSGDYTRTSTATTLSVSAKTSYKVTYNANGGSGAPSNQTKWHGSTLTLSSTKPTRSGYSFQGWGTSTSDTTVDYAAGANYTANANITLYAIWKANTYTVTYNANGGSGAPSAQTKTHGVALTLSSTKPTRTNYTFLGWGTSTSATTVAYNPGASYTSNTSITLYAIWELAYTKPRITNFSVKRCDSNKTADDSGTFGLAAFKWASDKTVSSIKIYYRVSTETLWTSVTVSATGTSGTVSQRIGSVVNSSAGTGSISLDSTYSVYVTVADSGGTSTSNTLTLNSQIFPIDALNGGNGVAFGKAAELNGYSDCRFKAKFRSSVEFDKTPTVNGTAVSLSNHTHTGDISATTVTSSSTMTANGALVANAGIEINHSTPYIDFHYGNSASDYTSRIIENSSGALDVNGTKFYSGGTTGSIKLKNNNPIYGKNAAGDTDVSLVSINSSNNITLGYGGYNLGIGNTYIYGNSTASIRSKGNFNVQIPEGTLYLMSDRFRTDKNDTFYLGDSNYKWKSVWAVTGTIQTSDRNKKEDINPVDSKYEKLFTKLKPVSYKLKSTDVITHDRKHTGFISQDIEEALAECDLTALDFAGFCKDIKKKDVVDDEENIVSTVDILDENGEPVYEYSLRYEEFIALNTHMIQKQQKTIDEQQKEIESLKSEVAELKDLVQQLLGRG